MIETRRLKNVVIFIQIIVNTICVWETCETFAERGKLRESDRCEQGWRKGVQFLISINLKKPLIFMFI